MDRLHSVIRWLQVVGVLFLLLFAGAVAPDVSAAPHAQATLTATLTPSLTPTNTLTSTPYYCPSTATPTSWLGTAALPDAVLPTIEIYDWITSTGTQQIPIQISRTPPPSRTPTNAPTGTPAPTLIATGTPTTGLIASVGWTGFVSGEAQQPSSFHAACDPTPQLPTSAVRCWGNYGLTDASDIFGYTALVGVVADIATTQTQPITLYYQYRRDGTPSRAGWPKGEFTQGQAMYSVADSGSFIWNPGGDRHIYFEDATISQGNALNPSYDWGEWEFWLSMYPIYNPPVQGDCIPANGLVLQNPILNFDGNFHFTERVCRTLWPQIAIAMPAISWLPEGWPTTIGFPGIELCVNFYTFTMEIFGFDVFNFLSMIIVMLSATIIGELIRGF